MKLDIAAARHSKEYDFEIVHPKYDEVKFRCKASGIKDDQALIKKHTPPPKFVRGKQVQGETNWHEVLREKFNRTVVDWTGITDSQNGGAEVPCDQDAKNDIYNRYSETLCQDIMEEVKERVAAEVGMDLGN